jgi:hypothetical protein
MEETSSSSYQGTDTNGQFIFKCRYCERNLSSRQNLKEHLYTHTGERPYECPEPGCGQTFRQGSLLSIHKKIHSEVKNCLGKPSIRKKCSYLKLSDVLNYHRNNFHLPLQDDEKDKIIVEIGNDFYFIKTFLT